MARPKKTTAAAKPEKKPRQDPRIERTYEETVEFNCPVRGKVRQKVTIKRYKPFSDSEEKHVLLADSALDKIENEDDGLSIYKEDEPEVT